MLEAMRRHGPVRADAKMSHRVCTRIRFGAILPGPEGLVVGIDPPDYQKILRNRWIFIACWWTP